MNKFMTKLGIFIGFMFFIFIYSYTILDAYMNIKNKESIVPNLTLFLAFFAWRKICQMDFALRYHLSNHKTEA